MDPVTAMLILGGANMVMGGMNASRQAAQRRQEAMIRAAEIEAAPWTKNAPQSLITTPAPNVWAEMAGGGLNAVGQYASMKRAGLFDEQPSKDPMKVSMNDPVLANEQIQALQGFKMDNAQTQPSFYQQSGTGGYDSGFGSSGAYDDSLWSNMAKKGAIA